MKEFFIGLAAALAFILIFLEDRKGKCGCDAHPLLGGTSTLKQLTPGSPENPCDICGQANPAALPPPSVVDYGNTPAALGAWVFSTSQPINAKQFWGGA